MTSENPSAGRAKPHGSLALDGFAVPNSAAPRMPCVLSPVCGRRLSLFTKPLDSVTSTLFVENRAQVAAQIEALQLVRVELLARERRDAALLIAGTPAPSAACAAYHLHDPQHRKERSEPVPSRH